MKVVVNTPDLLIVRHQPVVFPLLFTFVAVTLPVLAFTQPEAPGTRELIAVAMGSPFFLFAAWLTNKNGHFRFEARERRLRWSRQGPWSRAKGTVALEDIEGVLKECQHDHEGQSYRVALKTTEGRIPLTAHYSTIEPHDETVQQIRAWLEVARGPTAS